MQGKSSGPSNKLTYQNLEHMELEDLKRELNLCTPQEQDALASYLLYLRLKRSPKDLENLHHKVTDPSLASWSEPLFKEPK